MNKYNVEVLPWSDVEADSAKDAAEKVANMMRQGDYFYVRVDGTTFTVFVAEDRYPFAVEHAYINAVTKTP